MVTPRYGEGLVVKQIMQQFLIDVSQVLESSFKKYLLGNICCLFLMA
jgi:hypothetical protein